MDSFATALCLALFPCHMKKSYFVLSGTKGSNFKSTYRIQTYSWTEHVAVGERIIPACPNIRNTESIAKPA